jgi:dephospho-CoA kinase
MGLPKYTPSGYLGNGPRRLAHPRASTRRRTYLRPMLLVALTGNIAAGKSTVAQAWAAAGVPVLDADTASRGALAVGGAGVAAVRTRFGDEVVSADGVVDRAALGRIVFADAAARRDLEAIVHPVVQAERERGLAALRAGGAALVVCDIPLLFEAQLAWEFHRIVLVDAPTHVRRTRLIEHRGLSAADAEARVAAQHPTAAKRARSDLVIDNEGSIDALVAAAHAVLAALRAEARAPLVAAPARQA